MNSFRPALRRGRHDAADAAAELGSLQRRLERELRGMSGSRGPAARTVEHQGAQYVVKYANHRPPRRIRTYGVSLAYALVFRDIVRPRRIRALGIEHEAARLIDLRSRGVRVPRVMLGTPEFLVLEHCGRNLHYILKDARAEDRPALLSRAVAELAAFHRAGHWHGGAQLRNLTMKGDEIYRIDFEESAGAALPLPVMQAYDLVLCFHSLIDYLERGLAQASALLEEYFELAPDEEVDRSLRRLGRSLFWMNRWKPLLGGLPHKHKDVRRTLVMAQLLGNL